jgi:hypothetical protein
MLAHFDKKRSGGARLLCPVVQTSTCSAIARTSQLRCRGNFRAGLEAAYCRLVTISTDNITETNEYHSEVGARWPFLSDAGLSSKKISTSPITPILSMIPHAMDPADVERSHHCGVSQTCQKVCCHLFSMLKNPCACPTSEERMYRLYKHRALHYARARLLFRR